MEFKTGTNQSSSQRPLKPARASNDQGAAAPVKTKQSFFKDRKSKVLGAVTVIVVLLLLGGAWFVKKSLFSADVAIQHDKFQAVFLTNGQVYFGHLSDLEADYTKVTNVFYLQNQASQADDKAKDQQSQVTLTKLGSSELHGPQDTMYISKSQILFWENLKDDGKVVQAIKSSQKK